MTTPTVDNRPTSNFIRNAIAKDVAYWRKKQIVWPWSGQPGPLAKHSHCPATPLQVRTRFPPEPNGYLHFGHAKALLLNLAMAQAFDGVCHLRFDDTNPVKESHDLVESMLTDLAWLGCDLSKMPIYYASDYFEVMYAFAERFILEGLAYVDHCDGETIRAMRGTLTEPGTPSDWRAQTPTQALAEFRAMRANQYAEGACVLRLKIDLASSNMNLRDPVIYRIRKVSHHRTGDQWLIYPNYDFAHPISDALEYITHSLCTLEFEDHRPLYDWLIGHLRRWQLIGPAPKQIEYARLNLQGTVLSKRVLKDWVDRQHVTGWDDPRMPTIIGARKRGYSARGFKNFIETIGVAKAQSQIVWSTFENVMREDLNATASRRIAVIDPIPLILENWPEDDANIQCTLANHPQKPELGTRTLRFGKRLWIERADFACAPVKGFFRLVPAGRVRLRYAFVIECTAFEQNDDGQVRVVYARYFPDSRSGTAGSDQYKVKGNIHWLAQTHAQPAKFRLFDTLLADSCEQTDENYVFNTASVVEQNGFIEPEFLALNQPQQTIQCERLGYFVADQSARNTDGVTVFNRTVSLRPSRRKG